MHVAWGGVLHAEEGEGTQCLQRTDRKWCSGDLSKQDSGTHGAGGRGGAGPHWACRLREGVQVSTVNFQCLLLSSQCW